MKRYYTDDVAAICLDGIRAVQKHDNLYASGFSMTVTYKGNHFVLKYPTESAMNTAFKAICAELEKRVIGKKTDP